MIEGSLFLTLALLILGMAITVFFSKEFGSTFKKIAKIPGVLLIVPLLLATWLVVAFEDWLFIGFYYFRVILLTLSDLLAKLLPFQWGALILAQIILLAILSIVPVFLADWISKKRRNRPFETAPWWMLFIFTICLMNLIIPF